MNKIFWDTNLFVYLLQDDGERANKTAAMLAAIQARGDELITSALTLGEILVGGDSDQQRKAWQLEVEGCARIIPFDRAGGIIFGDIRRSTHIKAQDAIQLATAASAGVDLFITGDLALAAVPHVRGIRFITTLERAPL